MSVAYDVERRVDTSTFDTSTFETGTEDPTFNVSLNPWAVWLSLSLLAMIMIAFAVYGQIAPGA